MIGTNILNTHQPSTTKPNTANAETQTNLSVDDPNMELIPKSRDHMTPENLMSVLSDFIDIQYTDMGVEAKKNRAFKSIKHTFGMEASKKNEKREEGNMAQKTEKETVKKLEAKVAIETSKLLMDQFDIIRKAQTQYVPTSVRNDIQERVQKLLVPILSIPSPEEAEKFSSAYISEKENSHMEYSSTENTNTDIASIDSKIDESKTQDDSEVPEMTQESVEFAWDREHTGDLNIMLSSTQQKAMDYFRKGFSNFSFPGRKN